MSRDLGITGRKIMASVGKDCQYEVLSPWADVDPIPLSGISPRVAELSGKNIGLFGNGKRASPIVLTLVEEKLKKRFPDAQFSWYHPAHIYRFTSLQTETDNKPVFEEWLKNVDTVIAAVGD